MPSAILNSMKTNKMIERVKIGMKVCVCQNGTLFPGAFEVTKRLGGCNRYEVRHGDWILNTRRMIEGETEWFEVM